MYITEIKNIENYRNLSGLDFLFNKELNFIIGENNTGKTNLIEFLYFVFAKGKFSKKDFNDEKSPIKATIRISLKDEEIGFFDDYFDPEISNQLSIDIIQENPDDRIVYYSDGTNEIKHSIIKKLNTFYYHSQRTPNKEISFSREYGNGAILNYFVTKSLEKRNYNLNSYLDASKLNELEEDINAYIKKIGLLMNDSIKSYISEEPQNFISKMLEIGNSDGILLADLGDGIQYAFNILLSILDEILEKKKTYSDEKFEESLVWFGDKKYYPLLIVLDEPEIHQHPSRQRLIIKKIKEILDNQNTDFLEILKELFSIDGIVGQMFVVTHSPNILSNDYKQFIRLYRDNNQMKCICGEKVVIEDKDVKHLFSMLDEIKDSFFEHIVLLVEGDTEKGAFPLIAMKKGVDLDNYSANIFGMGGADNVTSLLEIFNSFGISAFAYLDRDKYDLYSDNPKISFTKEIDYENEIVSIMSFEEEMNAFNLLGKHKSIIGDLKKCISSFDPATYNKNFYVPNVTTAEMKVIEPIIRAKLIDEMKKNKNQVASYKIVNMMNDYPKSIIDFINKVKR